MSGSRVVLVDDDSVIVDSLAFLLEVEGFKVAGAATDLAGAMELAKSVEADVAVLDINLRRELVYPAADELIARNIPVLFTSVRPRDLPARFASTPFLEKPCLPEVLIDRIERLSSQVEAMRLAAKRNLEASASRLLPTLILCSNVNHSAARDLLPCWQACPIVPIRNAMARRSANSGPAPCPI
ncbi:response regulator [uncultured Rhodoblastus sp.]|uniref:response regulator n=1 Tax=uncultured Rhodoblastus sp. TaxID=543037 RepID=UPI0025E00B48|nr:response regulator [uncultured Rhodoblastus sp.]